MAGPLIGMLGKAGGAMFGSQVGAALGGLAGEVLTASDIGLPLGPGRQGRAGPPQHRRVRRGPRRRRRTTCCSTSRLREAAHQRLFAHVPWLRQHLISSVEDFGRGVTIDVSGIEQAMGQLDPTNLEAMQEALQGGLFEPQQTPQQKAALERLETTLALVEGWVDEVVGQATAERMPAAAKMQEAIRRRRAAGGPAEETFAALVGLELRPRRLRDASTLWGSLRSRQGTGGARRRLGAPRPAAHRRRPRRPAGLPRGPARGRRSSATRTSTRRSASCSTARVRPTATGRRPATGPATRRARRVSLHADARRRPRATGRRPTPEQERLRAAYVDHLRRPPGRRCGAPASPHHLTAGALVLSHDGAPRAAQPAPQGAALVPLRRPPRGRRPTLAGAALREATEESGLAGLRGRGRAAAPVRATGRASATRAARCDHLDVRFLARAGGRRRAGGQRGVARRALVAGRRAADRGGRHGRDDRPRPGTGLRRAWHGHLPAVGQGRRPRSSPTQRRGRRPRGSPWPARPGGSGRPSAQNRGLWLGSIRWASSCSST